MHPEPRRVSGSRIPLELFVRRSQSDSRLFDVVDAQGQAVASFVPDLITARLIASAPRLLDGFYEMNYTLHKWTAMHMEDCDEPDGWNDHLAWLTRMDEALEDAVAPDGRFPLAAE